MLKVYKLKICLSAILFAISSVVFGQQVNVTGIVTDENAIPLPGVTIIEKGTTTGVITDLNGKYSISAGSNQSVLVFSFVGYNSEEVIVGSQNIIDIQLLPSIEKLDEVIVIGYGSQKKSDITTSIVSLKSDKLTNETQGNFTAALQGKAAGVQVINNSGAPGAAPKVLIRGFTSINSSTDPLYVVDGMPIVGTDGNSGVNFISSDEIESIEVLKDASAAAIYGTRASSGVILINTKRGKTGKTKYNFSFSQGFQKMQKPYNVLNSANYVDAVNTSYINSGLDKLITNTDNLYNTNWWDECTQNFAPQTNVSFNVSGATDKYKFNITASYYNQESFYNFGSWDRFTARFNNDYKLNNWITVGVDLNPRREKWENTPDFYGDLLLIDPTTPVYIPADQLTGTENQYSIYQRSYYTYTWNPKARESRASGNGGDNYGLMSNAYIDIKPFENFVIRSQAGANIIAETNYSFNPEFVVDAAHEFNSITNLSRTKKTNFNWSWQNTATYNINIDKHRASFMAGVTAEQQNYDFVYAYGAGTANTSEAMRQLAAVTGTTFDIDGNQYTQSIASYLSRVTYNYDSRYLFTTTLRRDGSSKFMSKNKWAYFPSASAAWRFSNESFMQNLAFVSDAKLFAGWGTVGNQGIDDNVYLSTIATNYYVFGTDGAIVNTTEPSTIKNEDVKWERVEERNVGVEFSLFNSQLTTTVEGYKKITHDMLFKKSYPFYSSFPGWGQVWSNVGEMQATGLDLTINYTKDINKLSFDVTGTLTKAKMRMNEIDGSESLNGKTTWNSKYVSRIVVGDEPGFFYGYKTDGIFQNQFEVNSHTSENGNILQQYARPGDIRFVDTNNDGVLNADDRVKIGSPYADFTGGLMFSTTYKSGVGNFDLGFNLAFSYGNEAVNWLKSYKYNAGGQNNLASDALEQAWHGDGTSTDVPILSHNDLNENYTKFSDYYVEDASFLKLKSLQIGYSLPVKLCNTLKVSNARVYVSGQNLLTLTKFTGIDPETSFEPLSYGIQGFSYPMLKTYLVGLNISF